jgi:DNA-binding NarL/FixJ family response regulator
MPVQLEKSPVNSDCRTHENHPCLTNRQREVLRFLLKGKNEKEIARELRLSVHSVHVHMKGIYKRSNVTSRPELYAKLLPPMSVKSAEARLLKGATAKPFHLFRLIAKEADCL